MKNITLVVLVLLLLAIGAIIVLNKDRFKTPLQQEENKTTQTDPSYAAPSSYPTPSTTLTPAASVDIDVEVNSLDKSLDTVNPNDLSGSDLSNTAVGAE